MPDTAQKPTVLVLGGRGRTATPIASLLHAANIPFLVASPSTSPDSPFRQVIFDWWDEKTYENAWIKASQEGLKPISNIWLAGTGTFDIGPAMIKFVEFASSKGVNKFVLLSATTLEKGGPIMGEVHEHLDSTPGIEYVVLRPTWFMDNFSFPGAPQCTDIKLENMVYSTTKNGRIPFISAMDIARVAVRFLTDVTLPCKDYILVGPQLLTYDQVAQILTDVLGKKISHRQLTEAQLHERLMSQDMRAEDAEVWVEVDRAVEAGDEEIMNNVVEEVTGTAPESFRDFVNRVKNCWN